MSSASRNPAAVAPSSAPLGPLLSGRDLPSRSLGFDIALATILFAIALPLTWLDVINLQIGHRIQVGVTLLLAVAVALRRRFPLGAAGLAWATGLAQLCLGCPLAIPGDGLLLISLYSVTAFAPAWAGGVALAATILGSGIACLGLYITGSVGSTSSVVFIAALMTAFALAAWALGKTRSGLAASTESRRRAEQLTETDRERVAQLATAAERARIAREMHDIVAHSLSIVIAQADGGRYSGAKDPQAALTALETISQTGRAALADMRRILGVLRPDDDDAELAPQPDAQSLVALVDQVRAAGLQVSLVTLGVERTLPPGMGLAVYRICQEALTNAMKHAGPDAQVTLQCHWLPSQVTLDILDDGRGAAAESDHAGQGLTGMRQRAEMFGGTITAGPRPGGGFHVHVVLPTPVAPGTHFSQAGTIEPPGSHRSKESLA